MLTDEQELRQRLKAAADQVDAPRFTVESLAGRIQRRRAKIIGLASGSLLAVVALAVAVPVALSGTSATPVAHPPVGPFRLSFTVAVNGQSQVFPRNGPPPSFTVTPGEYLRIQVGVTVPAHAKVTTLWLGITQGSLTSPGRNGQRPADMHPVLAHTRQPLTPGLHTFGLTLTMPAQLHSGTSPLLVAAWTTKQDDASVAQPVAELVTPR
jgi:hypothetical protein